MEKEQIRMSFLKVKQDMESLQGEVSLLKKELAEIKSLLLGFHEELNDKKLRDLAQNSNFSYPTHNLQTPTHPNNPTHNPTLPQEIGGLKSQNLSISIGNEGVPTDKQSNQQTVQQTENTENIEVNLQEASEILNSLDKIKKEIRYKFKKLTSQEMTVFSTIYQLEEQNPELLSYKELARRLRLSESSIRDYVQRLIAKGIPLKKTKISNKKIQLSISPELKKIASLATIFKLREI